MGIVCFLAILLINTVDANGGVLHDSLTWEKAYMDAYKPAHYAANGDIYNQKTGSSAISAPSLADISESVEARKSSSTRAKPSTHVPSLDNNQLSTVEMFRMGLCLTSSKAYIANQRDQMACASTYSCMSFWGTEISFQMMYRQWCITNMFEKFPQMFQSTLLAPYRKYLHLAAAPLWNYIMLLTSPAREHGVDLLTGKVLSNMAASSNLQLVQSKQECEGANSVPTQVRCMMKKIQEVKFIRANLSNLSPNTYQAMQNVYGSHKKALSILESEGLAVLRNSIEDPIPLGFVDINPVPSPSNPPVVGKKPTVTSVPVGLAGPISTSVGLGMFGMASKNRYSAITPGLKMLLVEPTTMFIPESKSNDGSPGAIYLSRGKKFGRFHLYMPGGYFCYNQEMCFERCKNAPMLCSTKGWEQNVVFSGTFNPNNGGMEGWNHAVLGYTSSDAFLGQTTVKEFAMVGGTQIGTTKRKEAIFGKVKYTEAIFGSFFQGLTLLSATLRKFMILGLGRQENTILVISGCSAAAIGLAPITDMLPKLLKAQARALNVSYFPIEFLTIMDSAPITNGPPPINGEMPLPDQSQALLYMLYTMHGLNPGLKKTHPKCFAKFGNLCVWSPYVYPYLQGRNVVMHNMWDSFSMGNQAGAAGGSLNTTTYIWGLKLVLQENQVMIKCTMRQNMFGLNCYDHCYVENPWWWRLTPSTAIDPYWKWSAKDTFLKAMKNDLGHRVMDRLVQFDSGCIGQEFTNAALGYTQLKANIEHAGLTDMEVARAVAASRQSSGT